MQAAWHGRVAEDDTATDLWMRRLADTEVVPARKAISQLIESSVFPPTIAEFVGAVRDVLRYPEPGETRKALSAVSTPMDPNVAKRVGAEYAAARAARERRRLSVSAEEFIRSEGHDPKTHRLSDSGFVLRIPPPGKFHSHRPSLRAPHRTVTSSTIEAEISDNIRRPKPKAR
jgi:hypothetical protein